MRREIEANAPDRHSICVRRLTRPRAYAGSIIGTPLAQESNSPSSADAARTTGVDSNPWLRVLFETVPVAAIVEDLQGRIRAWNPEAERLFGWSAAEVLGRSLPFGPDADRMRAERRTQRVLDGERVHEAELDGVRQDGKRVAVSVLSVSVPDRDGRVIAILNLYADTIERKRVECHMSVLALVARALSECTSPDEAIQRVIQAFCGLMGWVCGVRWVVDPADGALRCQNYWHVPNDAALTDFVNALASLAPQTAEAQDLARRVLATGVSAWADDLALMPGSPRTEAARAAGLRAAFGFPISVDGEPIGVVELFARERRQPDRDLSRIAVQLGAHLGQFMVRRETEQRLEFVVSHDPLTGLPNRAIFQQRLGQALAQAARYEHKVALLFIDLDRFKIVNDTMGHEAGDRLLRQVAERFRDCLREGDTVGRHGGDEFVVLIEQYESAIQVAGVAQKIIDQSAIPFELDGQEFHISASIGIATYPSDAQDGPTLLKHADIAMYRAKEAGKNQYQFYSPHMNRLSLERLEMETALRHALERGELSLCYQPKYDMSGRRVLSMEALLRWHRPQVGVVMPAEFISVAEETGLAVPIGEWVLRTACAQARSWQDHIEQPVRVAVNVSPRHFAHGNLVGCVDDVLRATRLQPDLLELEITETMALQNVERSVRVLRMLKELGVRIAIDDFGTGYSSLGYLKRFPLDAVKVDRSLVSEIPHGTDGMAVARAVIAMAHSLSMSVVAEGVETDDQAQFLRGQGCDEMQGNWLSRPLDLEQASELLARSVPGGDAPG